MLYVFSCNRSYMLILIYALYMQYNTAIWPTIIFSPFVKDSVRRLWNCWVSVWKLRIHTEFSLTVLWICDSTRAGAWNDTITLLISHLRCMWTRDLKGLKPGAPEYHMLPMLMANQRWDWSSLFSNWAKNTNLLEDDEFLLTVKFCQIPCSSCRGLEISQPIRGSASHLCFPIGAKNVREFLWSCEKIYWHNKSNANVAKYALRWI